ncbi:MAG TPA: NCS2 family permease [Gemmatimonadota bacterium]|nr:NCS2 family permease [Gemmatimonadota bacterium]
MTTADPPGSKHAAAPRPLATGAFPHSIGREILAGTTTFATMAYIIVVNPKILEAAGIPFGPSMVATILTAALGTLLMGVWARRPFAVAPYMGQNAFVAYTVVGVLGYPWQTALGAIFIGGSLFTLLSLFRARELLAESIPDSLKRSFAVGIGLFLAFIGLTTMGVVAPGAAGVPVTAGDLSEPAVQLAVAGFALMVLLHLVRVPGSILLAILATAGGAMLLGLAPRPEALVGAPPDLSPTFLALDIRAALTWGFASVILAIFVLDLVDTIGTLIGLAYKSGLLDEEGRMPGMEKALQCDALSTVVGSLLGTTTSGAYIESATGIEAGGRTGLTAIVTALWFLAALFFAPLLSSVPPAAYGPALVMVGMLMLEPIRGLPFDDLVELLPAFLTITLMSFTYDLGIGITAGLGSHVLLKVATGRAREVKTGMWVLGGLSVLFYVFYPY